MIWRVGRRSQHNVYEQAWSEPSDDDRCVGHFHNDYFAAAAVDAFNQSEHATRPWMQQATDQPPAAGINGINPLITDETVDAAALEMGWNLSGTDPAIAEQFRHQMRAALEAALPAIRRAVLNDAVDRLDTRRRDLGMSRSFVQFTIDVFREMAAES